MNKTQKTYFTYEVGIEPEAVIRSKDFFDTADGCGQNSRM